MKKPAKKAIGGLMGASKLTSAAAKGLSRAAASPMAKRTPFKKGGKAKKC